MANQVRVEGLRELNANLKRLTDKVQRRVLNRAVNAGARVIRDEAKQNAPVDTGKLKRNIITAKRRAPKGQAEYVVTVRGISQRTGNSDNSMKTNDPKNAFYARFIEFGTSKVSRAQFLAPAFESKKHEAMAAIKKALGEGIEKEARMEGVRL